MDPDCAHKVTIGADLVERVVTDAVKAAISDMEGRASAERGIREAVAARDRAQAALDAAIRAFDELGDEPVALERLRELRRARDEAEEHLQDLGGGRASRVVRAADWGDLTLEERRALIRATVLRATVAPGGRGASRIRVELFGQ